jgi:hypothetical protein
MAITGLSREDLAGCRIEKLAVIFRDARELHHPGMQ